MPTSGEWTRRRVAKMAELEDTRPCAANVDGVDLVLLRDGAHVRAYEARCPHQGMLLSEGEIENGQLVCRGHGWRFDIATGQGKRACLRAYPVEIEGDDVVVTMPVARVSEKKAKALRTVNDLPGPRGLPLVGNSLQVKVPRVHEILETWARTFGALYKCSIAGKTIVVVSDPTLSEPILRARPHAVRRQAVIANVLGELGADGVFSAEGPAWRAQRRLTMQALSNKNTRALFPTLRRVTERLHARFARSAESREALVIQDDLMRFTVDVTTGLVFCIDTNTIEGGEDVLQRHLQHFFPAAARRVVAPFPYWRYIKFPQDRAVATALVEIRRFQDELVKTTRARLEERRQKTGDEGEPQDFMEAMLLARDEDGNPFSDEILYGNMLTLLLAGEDTTANSIAWTVHYLCDHPDVVARMRAEVDPILGDANTPADLDAASTMPYVDAVANEAMRLRPVAPFLGFEALEDLVIGDVAVPKGGNMFVLTRPPALDPTNFSDPEAFRPERWLAQERSKGEAHVPGASIPFGAGPRICPGRALALLEMRIVLAMLVRSFDIERVGRAADVRELFSFTMLPTDLRVRLVKRERQQAALTA